MWKCCVEFILVKVHIVYVNKIVNKKIITIEGNTVFVTEMFRMLWLGQANGFGLDWVE